MKVRNVLNYTLFVFVTMFIMSCSFFTKEANSRKNKAYISVRTNYDFNRAILPTNLQKEDLSYELYGGLGNTTQTQISVWDTYNEMLEAQIEIQAGEWNFTLHAFSGTEMALEGSLSQSIIYGDNALNFELSEIETGNGSVSVAFVYPKDKFAKITAGLQTEDGVVVNNYGAIQLTPVTINEEDIEKSKVVYSKTSVPKGVYMLCFNLYTDENAEKASVYRTIIQVEPGCRTEGREELKGNDEIAQITIPLAEIALANKKEDFVLVEPGSFERSDGATVTITRPFYICDHEVTQGEYEEIMGENPSYVGIYSGGNPFLNNDIPVSNINIKRVIAYCNKLSVNEGLTPCYENEQCDFFANGYRLPTEAEWEFAARGGKKSKGFLYSGSNIYTEVGVFTGNTPSQRYYSTTEGRYKTSYIPSKVKQLLSNELGIYDMSGNVSELCWDYYAEYNAILLIDPVNLSEENYRVVRGGNYQSNYENMSVDSRSFSDFGNLTGFRIVCTKDTYGLNFVNTKKNYYLGETLDLSGIKISATYSDGYEKEITDFTSTPANGTILNTAGTQTVTINYKDKSLTFEINVLSTGIISVLIPEYQNIENLLSFDGSINTFLVDADYSSYSWWLDNSKTDTITNTFPIDTATLEDGQHFVMVVVKDVGGNTYSTTASFVTEH